MIAESISNFFADSWLLWILLSIGGLLWWYGRDSQYFNYVFNRYVLALITLLIVSGIVFSLMEVLPGDCAEKYIAYKNTQGETITQADIDAERARMGLDQPLAVRWASWVTDLTLRGDLGFSCAKRQSVNLALGDRFWMSFMFCMAGLVFSYLIAVPFRHPVCVHYQQDLDRQEPAAHKSRAHHQQHRPELSESARPGATYCQLPGPGAAKLPAGADHHPAVRLCR